MKKNLLLRLCLILMLALTIYSCRTDQFPEQETYNNSSKFQLTSKRISLNKSKHKGSLFPELKKAEAKLKSFTQKNTQGKTIDYGNGVSIDTDNVIYIENGPNYHTYTFTIKRENAPADAPIENLVLSPLTDGTYRELLFSYHLTPQEKQTFIDGGFVDIKNKFTVTDLEKGSFNSGGELARSQSQSCTLEYEYYYTTCSENMHDHGEQYPACTAGEPSELVFVIREVCTPSPGGSDGSYNPVDPNYPGGGGGDDSGDGSSTPCNGNGVPTGPQAPASGIGYESGDGCGSGIPTQPNIPNPGTADPCRKTKALLEDPVVKNKIDTLEAQSKKTGNDRGEKAFLYMNDNTSSSIIDGENHQVNLTGYTGYKGIYHNHTPLGTKMLAVKDIIQLYKTVAFKLNSATAKEAFVGMVAYETCNCPPDNFVYHNYLLRFNGDFSQTGAIATLSDEQIKKFRDDFDKIEMDLLSKPSLKNGLNLTAELNAQGLQQLFFGTLAKMKIDPGQIILQKIEKDGTINNINLNTDGTTTPVPCPK